MPSRSATDRTRNSEAGPVMTLKVPLAAAIAVAAIGLASCSDSTPWAYPTEPAAAAQRPQDVAAQALPAAIPGAAKPGAVAPRTITPGTITGPTRAVQPAVPMRTAP